MEKWVGIGQAGPSVQNEQIWKHQGQVFSDASFACEMLTEESFLSDNSKLYIVFIYYNHIYILHYLSSVNTIRLIANFHFYTPSFNFLL